MKELGVTLITADHTNIDDRITHDLTRMDRRQLPVNLIYPVNYPEEPAILLEGIFFANHALKALDRVAPKEDEAAQKVVAQASTE